MENPKWSHFVQISALINNESRDFYMMQCSGGHDTASVLFMVQNICCSFYGPEDLLNLNSVIIHKLCLLLYRMFLVFVVPQFHERINTISPKLSTKVRTITVEAIFVNEWLILILSCSDRREVQGTEGLFLILRYIYALIYRYI